MVFYAAEAANLHPELERPGLLPQRPEDGALAEDGSSAADFSASPGARRPADVYIPRWRGGPPAAWDFAVTSGLRLGVMAQSLRDPSAALTSYEHFNCSHRETERQCRDQGITFVPMIIEAHGGGWGKVAKGIWCELAKTSALATGELESERSCATMLQQRLAMTLHRENARACLKCSAR